jgi:cellulose synthase/poly-beta-1,6-N-acetylglucosamine synthase-like glycosyltransferase
MQLILQIIFWGALLLMLHSYVLFPLWLAVLAKGKRDNDIVFGKTDELPHVFILMSAYNEEKVIGEKLRSVFETTYPIAKISFYIGSDNSSDRTNEIISAYSVQYPQLRFYPYTDRNGKSGVLNRLFGEIKANGYSPDDVFILTDANVFFSADTIFQLVRHFKNKNIGQVAANILNKGQKEEGISRQETSYIQRENIIKYHEGKIWGAMQGAFGACYAMRASCYAPIPPNFLMEDFYISMGILKQGKQAITELDAICYEDVSDDVSEEFKRKTRISTGNYQNLGVYWPMLFRFDGIAFCFLSHKVLRWMGPFIIIAMVISSGLLALTMTFYLWIFALLLLFLVSPLIDKAFKAIGINFPLLRFASYFNLMNLALLYGLYKYLTGVKTSAWSPTKRNV